MNEYGNYLRRVDLVKNQIEREKIREQQDATARNKSIQQQNAKRFADYQRVLRTELDARWFHNVLSTGGSVATSSVDADAQAFITAASITDPTQQSAINTLVVDLKGYNIWTKFKAIYPIVGGTAAQHKFNLKDPRDLDAAFRLTFASGWTHSSTGMTPTNAYADTFFNPNSGFSVNDNVHLSYYSRTNSNGTEIEIGSATTVGGPYLILEIRTSGTTYYIMNSSGTYATASDSDSRAFYIGNRIGTAEKGFRNNTNVISRTSAATPRPNFNTYLGAFNAGGTATYLSTKECAFASIGDGLTDTEAANFYTAVQTYQTTLSRQV